MTLDEFLQIVEARRPLDTPDVYRFMDEMSDEARRLTFALNSSYHSQEEINELLGRLFGRPVGKGFKMFPPFYTDFGKNTHIGDNVFINDCCHFQDHGGVYIGDCCQVGHSVVMATLNHGLKAEERRMMTPAPIVLGRNVWVGSNSTILQGVTVGDNAVIAAGAVVTRDVPADTVVAGVPARPVKHI